MLITFVTYHKKMSLEQDLEKAKVALEEANDEYKRTYDVWKNLPLGTSEKDEAKAKELKNDAKDAAIRAQKRVEDLEAQIKERDDRALQRELAQGRSKFISSSFYI